MMDDSRWLALCELKGRESPDPKTQVGCIIVGPDGSAFTRRIRTLTDESNASLRS